MGWNSLLNGIITHYTRDDDPESVQKLLYTPLIFLCDFSGVRAVSVISIFPLPTHIDTFRIFWDYMFNRTRMSSLWVLEVGESICCACGGKWKKRRIVDETLSDQQNGSERVEKFQLKYFWEFMKTSFNTQERDEIL